MVRPLLLVKILHCKRLRKKDARNSLCQNSLSSSHNLSVKKESSEPELVCRICLKEGNIPIFGEGDDVADALNTFAGVIVLSTDEYPKYLCSSCDSLLKGAILLRRTAQRSDRILKRVHGHTAIDFHENSFRDSFDETFNDDNDTFQNIAEMQEKKVNDYFCKQCDLFFKTFEEYSEHRLSEEHENKRFTCTICNKSYMHTYFKKHMALHKQDAPYMCDICGKKFIIQGQFTRHRLTHFYDLPFKCSLCPYKGRFSESLKLHMRSHTGEKPYQCSECPARFVTKSNLNKHTLTHKTEHDFKCELCGRGFYTKKSIELHFKVDHTGIKDHVCNICGKAFGYRKQMMKHQLKVHKREKLRTGRMPLYLQVESHKQLGEGE